MSSTHLDLWIGTYPPAGAGSPAGRGEGVWRARFDLASDSWLEAHQVADLPAPSFLVAHPSGAVLYAVGETADGTVT
ncbi:MAG TPA: beta-propeller fold lactonase family protein, partial [Cellulomonadaceae bacterium]|nr:beta-propeller fold lactonase family protein [Cellulomonadaceae bacterium]